MKIDDTFYWNFHQFNFRFNKLKEARTILREIKENSLTLWHGEGKVKEFPWSVEVRWMVGARGDKGKRRQQFVCQFSRLSTISALDIQPYHRIKKVFNSLKLSINHLRFWCRELFTPAFWFNLWYSSNSRKTLVSSKVFLSMRRENEKQ